MSKITFSSSAKKAMGEQGITPPADRRSAAQEEAETRAEMMRIFNQRRDDDSPALKKAYDHAFRAWKTASEKVVAEMRAGRNPDKRGR